jgi:protein-disulfide isomerase
MPITRRTILSVVGAAVAAGAGYAGWRLFGRTVPAGTLADATPVPAAIAQTPPTPASPAPAQPVPAGPQFAPRTLGSDSAPVKVHEYFSLTCTHCAHFANATMPQVKPNLIDTGKVQFIYHDFPLDQVALKAAQVARYLPTAEYYPFIEALFASQDDWAFQPNEDYHASIFKYAALAGMDQATYEKAWNDNALAQFIVAAQQQDETVYKIQATPTFIINGKVFPGAMEYDDFAAKVAAAAAGG